MKEKMMPFSKGQIKAILRRWKNQFRLVVEADIDKYDLEALARHKYGNFSFAPLNSSDKSYSNLIFVDPPFRVGDRIKIQEPWAKLDGSIHYEAAATKADLEWLASWIVEWQAAETMPPEYSRLTIEITGISVQRIQGICATDALSEGIADTEFWQPSSLNEKPFEEKWWDDFHFWSHYPQMAFADYWKATVGEESWEKNKWVWVYRFKEVKNK